MLEIEIRKVKITEKIINQLVNIGINSFLDPETKCLGFVNTKKGVYFLLEKDGKYFKMKRYKWEKTEYLNKPSCYVAYLGKYRLFDDEKERNMWLNKYNKMVEESEQVYF